MTVAKLNWHRLELDDGDVGRFAELTHRGAHVYVRLGKIGEPGRVQHTELRSQEAARKSVTKRMVTLESKGYARDGGVSRPLPEEELDARARQKAEHSAARALAILALPEAFCAYADEWTALGFPLEWTFRKTAARRNRPHTELATMCVGLAEKHFGVSFSFRTEIDVEHGTTGPLRPHDYSQHYCCPLCVAAIAEERLLDRGSTDGGAYRGCNGTPFSGSYAPPIRVMQGRALWKSRRAEGRDPA